nr:hypothetical protein [uncultured Gellertiella sp.]
MIYLTLLLLATISTLAFAFLYFTDWARDELGHIRTELHVRALMLLASPVLFFCLFLMVTFEEGLKFAPKTVADEMLDFWQYVKGGSLR